MSALTRDIRKVKDLKDESLADYSIQRIGSMAKFNQEHGRHAQEIAITPDGVIIAGTAIYRALQIQGVEEVEVIILDIPKGKIQHTRNIYDAVPENFKSLIQWLVESHRYYLDEGAPYRTEYGNGSKGTIREFLGGLCGWSHESVRKALAIGESEYSDDLIKQMDEEDVSLDKAYHKLKDAQSEQGYDGESTDAKQTDSGEKQNTRSRGLIGGNTPEFELSDTEKKELKSLFADESNRLREQVEAEKLPDGCSLRINRSRNGDIESYSCTYRTVAGTFTAYYIPDKVKKQGNE